MPRPMPRRHFLTAAGSLAVVTTAGCGPRLRNLQLMTLTPALAEMQRLLQSPTLTNTSAWGLAQTLEHLAQSIEYSMTGYPQPKSALFQRAIGQPAFAFFSWRGQMQHDLAEPIPGSPALSSQTPLAHAALRLMTACQQFMQWQQPLQPHFAYGALSHPDYEQAHAMHLANHFAAFHTA